jgi:hypothetical protein
MRISDSSPSDGARARAFANLLTLPLWLCHGGSHPPRVLAGDNRLDLRGFREDLVFLRNGERLA